MYHGVGLRLAGLLPALLPALLGPDEELPALETVLGVVLTVHGMRK